MLIVSRTLCLLLLLTSLPLVAEESLPAPKTVTTPQGVTTLETLTTEWTRQTGYRFDLAWTDPKLQVPPSKEKPFWEAVETVARQTKTRIALKETGKVIALRPLGKGAMISSLDGPFRFVVREVRCKRDLEIGQNSYEVNLDVHWEPRFEVFRIDEPLVLASKDDTGKSFTSPHFKNTSPVSGYFTSLKVNLNGITRASQKVDLEGTVTATLAEEMLTFKLDDLTKPTQLEQKQVGIHFRSARKDGKNLSCTFDLIYPRGGAVFESFQQSYWLRANEFTLIAPDGKRFPVEQFENTDGSLTYHLQESQATGKLPQNLIGWKAEIRTPGVIRDVGVRFELKGIELP